MIYINNENKIKRIIDQKDNCCFFLDYDKTITTSDSEDSWAASANREAMGNKIADTLDKLYEKYAPIEVDYSLDTKQKEKYMVEWYSKCLDSYYNNGLTKKQLEESILKSNIIFRKGVKDFFVRLEKENIPVIILSAGIGNVIQKALEMNGCYYSNIKLISNFLKFDSDGHMVKYKHTMIHTFNKNIDLLKTKEIDKTLSTKNYRIVIGDLIEDINMVGKWNDSNLIKIGFLNDNIDKNLEYYNKSFDIVLTNTDNNFYDILNIFYGNFH